MRTHGIAKTTLYHIWHNMICRCHRAKCKDYVRYGQRGITVCIGWRYNPKAFYDWAIENGWKHGLQVDRIDNDKGYSPKNCRIVTASVQASNRRDRRELTIFGETKSVREWTRDPRCCVKESTFERRIYFANWKPEVALTKPARPTSRTFT